MAADLQINGIDYSIGKINDVFEQSYLITRFAPIIAGMSDGNPLAIFDKIGTLDKTSLKEIYYGLLQNVKRKNDSGTFSPISSNGKMMYADITMSDGFALCKASFLENFSDFLAQGGLSLAAI